MKKVCLVEDDPNMSSLLQTFLKLEGFEIVMANFPDIEKIIKRIKEEKPDYIFLDVNLRNINGFDILKTIRNDPKLNQTKVIMTSGMDLENRCLKAGANHFLMKPFMPEELIKRLK